ncbi:MAG: serine/threonine-protein kinase [Candidatus Sumerlaeota bacterium]|nr:serine/threonine-protein kinase [Candidatus Sumerlaeota bacterium]
MREISVEPSASRSECIGPYEILDTIGRGGMGQVVRGRDPRADRVVAIKILAGELAGDAEAVARFEREIAAVSSIHHPNVAEVLDRGLLSNGQPYIVMEFLDGPSLADLIRNRLDLPFSRVARLMREAAQGLHAAFKVKIIHRDVKPANLMLAADDTLKIVDFGLAKNLFENTFRTMPGAILGTPRYMSPEQGRGQSIDHRSDMYSLGASFYHLTAGQPPFEAETSVALMMMHIQTPLMPLYVINPHAPGDLCEVIHRLMAKDPNDRYADYDDLIAELRQVEMARRAKEEADRDAACGAAGSDWEKTIVLSARPDSPAPQTLTMNDGRVVVLPPEPIPPNRTALGRVVGLAAWFAILFALVTLLTRGKPEESTRRNSALGALIARIIYHEPVEDEKSGNEKLNQELELTRERMKTIYKDCLIFEARKGEFPRRAADLVGAGIVGSSEIVDGWGRPFAIYPVRRELISFGKDGAESTQDDFRLEPNGIFSALPVELQELDMEKAAQRDSQGS